MTIGIEKPEDSQAICAVKQGYKKLKPDNHFANFWSGLVDHKAKIDVSINQQLQSAQLTCSSLERLSRRIELFSGIIATLGTSCVLSET